MLIAQITDAHFGEPGQTFFGGYLARPAAERVIAHLNALEPRPDLVVFTGDLTEEPTEAAYAEARSVLAALDLPLIAIPGNHDDRRRFRATLEALGGRVGGEGFLHLALEAGPVRLIGLDTVEDALAPGGRLCSERLAWIEARLAEAPDRPTLIFMHHPPFAVGIAGMDRIRCEGGEALAAILARHRQVRRVLCGHVHRSVSCDWAGTAASVAPSIAWEVGLDLRPGARNRHRPQAPAYQLHLVAPDGALLTHTVVVR